jgi:hypothetical protein
MDSHPPNLNKLGSVVAIEIKQLDRNIQVLYEQRNAMAALSDVFFLVLNTGSL